MDNFLVFLGILNMLFAVLNFWAGLFLDIPTFMRVINFGVGIFCSFTAATTILHFI